MSVEGSRVAVIGGSIAGCAAAIALTWAGCDVTVYERTRGTLRDRGFGIGIPAPLHDELVSAGYLDPGTPTQRYAGRTWVVRDADSAAGRVLARQRMPVACENWGILWRTLRAKVPEGRYHEGVSVTGVQTNGQVTVIGTSGPRPRQHRAERFDLVVGADGYLSTVRSLVAPDAALLSSGYAIWRGTCPRHLVPEAALREVDGSIVQLLYPGGHAVAYLIPGDEGSLLNWGAYISPAEFGDPRLIPPGSVGEELLARLDVVLTEYLPPLWADTFRRTGPERVSVQPIYDLTTSAYASSRLALIGDAGSVARPHTASGATTALQDAVELERCCRTGQTWAEVLGSYDRARRSAGNEQTELGRLLGRALVTHPPDWTTMSSGDFRSWWQAVSAGSGFLYE
jgi:2-polyprenyl-6-methoxyphenol hydroxylase-like FAD-dependent oxidoreductase